MSSYPKLGQSIASTETRLNGKIIDRATNGAVRARSYYSQDKKLFNVVHSVITTAQKAIIEDFYTANKDSDFDFMWVLDGNNYICMFADTPMNFEIINIGYWNAEVFLMEV